jgi:ribosomal protein S8E
MKIHKNFFQKLLSDLLEKQENFKKIKIISMEGNTLNNSYFQRGIIFKGEFNVFIENITNLIESI